MLSLAAAQTFLVYRTNLTHSSTQNSFISCIFIGCLAWVACLRPQHFKWNWNQDSREGQKMQNCICLCCCCCCWYTCHVASPYFFWVLDHRQTLRFLLNDSKTSINIFTIQHGLSHIIDLLLLFYQCLNWLYILFNLWPPFYGYGS